MIKLSRASTKHVHMTFVFRWFQKKETFRWHYLVPFPAILILLSGVQDWKGGGLLYARFYLYLSPCSMTQNNACKSGLLQWQFGVEKTHTHNLICKLICSICNLTGKEADSSNLVTTAKVHLDSKCVANHYCLLCIDTVTNWVYVPMERPSIM